jgi:hypothetical protein
VETTTAKEETTADAKPDAAAAINETGTRRLLRCEQHRVDRLTRHHADADDQQTPHLPPNLPPSLPPTLLPRTAPRPLQLRRRTTASGSR